MDFEVVLEDESADPEQVAALQNLTHVDEEIARLKLHFNNRVRVSQSKPDPEAGAFSRSFTVKSHKTDLVGNGLVLGSSVQFLEESDPPAFMFTSEDTEGEHSGEKRVFAAQASQALTEVAEPAECRACPHLREENRQLRETVSRLAQQNRLLERSSRTFQEQLHQANATVRKLQRKQHSSSERDTSDEWVHKFMSLLASNDASRAYENQSAQRLIAEKAVQCVIDPVKAELSLLLESPATARSERPRHSPDRSPGSMRRGSFWGLYSKDRKQEQDCLLRPQIIQRWADSFRSGSTSPMSRTITHEEKAKVCNAPEDRMRKRILNLMKEREVLRMLTLQHGGK